MIQLINLVKKHWVVLTLLILTAITILSLWPADQLHLGSGRDKIQHFIAYAALMLPVALRKPKSWIALGTFLVIYSGIIELIQPFVNRYGEWADLLANTGGVLFGIIIAAFLNFITKVKGKAEKCS